MSAFLRLLRRASALPVLLASGALFALMVMTFCDVILRSAFNAPIEAATELTRILMAIIVFSVLPMVSARGHHIAVDLTDPFFHRVRAARLRDGMIHLLSGAMLYWPFDRLRVLAERQRSYGDVTEYLAIPQFYISWFIALAVALAGLAMLVVGVLTLIAPKLLRDAQ
ncbi:C4-dicarboxylate ABC transporter permease [Maritimibacter sp. 55A14]|uniref:TRAP transporter small permease n=1 Tax=Maritimibacter sp. 55A14 TaxID=2174844 RepID=UPI000D612D1B|nr:TRAP transporter small permease subunit [Maritimibacter sp. 55A14]PWE32820.1 C4-dicarboxylate ABC transporter permease [Maritimibacter sp. 55A14]